MRIVVTTDRRFKKDRDGIVWSTSSSAYGFWQRYLTVFDRVLVIARTELVDEPGHGWNMVTGPHVEVLDIPHYIGLSGFLYSLKRINALVGQSLEMQDAVLLRIPSHLALSIEHIVRKKRQLYAAEVVGNPYEMFAPGAVSHPFRPAIRYLTCRFLRRQCANACAISYVTEHALQKFYPPSSDAYVTYYSSVDLPDDEILPESRTDFNDRRETIIISVGSMEMRYKGFDVLLDALAICISASIKVKLVLIGTGRQKKSFEEMPSEVRNHVQFLGELPGSEAVRSELMKADLFVLASKTEGLPRVIIEAMSVGLPCIATRVGGTSELLPADCLVHVGDAKDLAAKIKAAISVPHKLREMSARNLLVAKRYASSVLQKRRIAMYAHLREMTETAITRMGV